MDQTNLRQFFTVASAKWISQQTFLFTGFRDAQLKSWLESHGGKVVDNFNKAVTVLVTADADSNSAKAKAAQKNKVFVITKAKLVDFYKIPLNQPSSAKPSKPTKPAVHGKQLQAPPTIEEHKPLKGSEFQKLYDWLTSVEHFDYTGHGTDLRTGDFDFDMIHILDFGPVIMINMSDNGVAKVHVDDDRITAGVRKTYQIKTNAGVQQLKHDIDILLNCKDLRQLFDTAGKQLSFTWD